MNNLLFQQQHILYFFLLNPETVPHVPINIVNKIVPKKIAHTFLFVFVLCFSVIELHFNRLIESFPTINLSLVYLW